MDGDVTIVSNVDPVKIDLACGQCPADGFIGYDLHAPETDRVRRLDLLKFPWPIETASVDEARSSHYIEHIPMRETEDGKDLFFAFFDELHRVLKPGAPVTIIWPALQSVRAFQDPTHRRFIPWESLLYLNAGWRAANGLDHYRVACDFDIERWNPTVEESFGLRSPDAQGWMLRSMWNVAVDNIATLRKR